jgi:phosphate/phosphite/phosphonate ABC transporter binding protein
MGSGKNQLTFGLVVPAKNSQIGADVDRLTAAFGERFGGQVVRRDAASYEALVDDVREGRTDLAWLPPIPFVRLGEAVTALGSVVRDGNSTYEAALVVHAKSHIRTLDGLRGSRAGWVDRWSASGYVLPRMNLSLTGLDPRKLFSAETFHGSHRSAIQALLAGLCDVTGTYARADDSGHVTTGAWSEIEGAHVRVLATFGAIPPDVLAARSALPPDTGTKAFTALQSLANDDTSLLRSVFGGDDLREGLAPGYESLKAALDMATARGIFGEG